MKFGIWLPGKHASSENLHYYNFDEQIKGYVAINKFKIGYEQTISINPVDWPPIDVILHGDSIMDVIRDNPELLL